MRVRSLKLTGFRNYRSLDFIPGEGLNVLYGQNAQGKTNVLEALSLLATTRSLRATRESELIRGGEEMAHVTAEVSRDREGDAELMVSVFQGDKKAVRVNGLRRPRVVDLLGQFNAVFFGSLDLAIITGEPSDRRHYLNVEISQISPRYVYDLAHYKRILAQRNRLLRELRERPMRPQDAGLDVWDEQLVNFGAPLLEKRLFYIERLAPLADVIHRELTDGRESLDVRYVPSFPLPGRGASGSVRESREDRYLADAQADAQADAGAGTPARPGTDSESESPTLAESPDSAPESAPGGAEAVAEAFRRHLGRVAPDEARRGTTLLGPQRDDLTFLINDADARIYGSQGQQRTVALSLKLAEFRLIEDYVGEPPVMLLDDVMSDLDDARRAHLLAWVRRRCQTFLTCTNLRAFPEEILAEARLFRVEDGRVTPDVERTAAPQPGPEPAPLESARPEPSTAPADGDGADAGRGAGSDAPPAVPGPVPAESNGHAPERNGGGPAAPDLPPAEPAPAEQARKPRARKPKQSAEAAPPAE